MDSRIEDDELEPVGRSRRRSATPPPRLTRHAVERWSERVGGSPASIPAAALERFLRSGRRRPRPRHWTRTHAEPGTSFVHLADQPDVCVVVRNRAAVTVLTRDLCRGGAR